MNSSVAFVVIPLLALVIAALSAAGIWYWWISGSEEKDKEDVEGLSEEEDPIIKLPRLDFLRRGAALVSGASPPENVIEVMRVYRDLADGSLVVEIAGQHYRHIGDIDDPEIARRLVGNVRALTAMAELSGEVGASSPAPPMSRRAAQPQRASPPIARPLPSRRRAAAEAESSEPVRRGIFGQRKGKTPPEPPPKSMIEQIEEFLQYRLATSPELAGRDIHITEGETGNIIFEVDGLFYGGVGDIPDEFIRGLIQTTIQEWEARQ